jgi:hypothetical protein
MKRIAFLFVAVVTVTGVVAWMAPSSLGQDKQTDSKEAKQIIVTTIPPGYRDWKFISVAHEAGELNDIRVVIGNDKAIEAYRAGKPFPEGTIIGRVAWKMVPSEENNKIFGQPQSFVPGDAPDWYLQSMEKNTEKYAATGGWGYSNFGKDLKPATASPFVSTETSPSASSWRNASRTERRSPTCAGASTQPSGLTRNR